MPDYIDVTFVAQLLMYGYDGEKKVLLLQYVEICFKELFMAQRKKVFSIELNGSRISL